MSSADSCWHVFPRDQIKELKVGAWRVRSRQADCDRDLLAIGLTSLELGSRKDGKLAAESLQLTLAQVAVCLFLIILLGPFLCRQSVRLSVCLPACLAACRRAYLPACLTVGSPTYLPLPLYISHSHALPYERKPA